MSDSDFQVFQETVEAFQENYPSRNISLNWEYDRWIVYADNKQQFTTKGYNLLYCLSKLTSIISDELL